MAFGDEIRAFLSRKKAGLRALLQEWAGKLEGYAKENAPWTDRTSHARQGLHGGVDVKRSREYYVLYLSHGVEYGIYLEEGTKPHIIKPRTKKALYWQGLEHPVKQAHHPGSKKYAILEPTVDEHLSDIRRSIEEFWEG